jgi:IS1 family transposase
MNKLPLEKRVQILSMLVEGSSMRSISRVADVSINTVTKLLVEAGEACASYHYSAVRGVKAKRVQADEIWSFCYAKEKNVATAKAAAVDAGDVWTWTAIDADSKLMISYMVGGRDAEIANMFMDDVAQRIDGRVQLTTDGNRTYLDAVQGAFGSDIDYAMLVKLYGSVPEALVSTSYVERANLTIRMGLRRFTRLTNAFSKKIDNHVYALSLYFVFYNFCRIHKTLRVTPAMAAGISDTARDMEWIVGLIDARAKKPGKRGPYKKAQKVA